MPCFDTRMNEWKTSLTKDIIRKNTNVHKAIFQSITSKTTINFFKLISTSKQGQKKKEKNSEKCSFFVLIYFLSKILIS